MFSKSLHFPLLLCIAALSGCATRTPANRKDLAAIRSVAENYGSPAVRGRSGNIAGTVARHGAGFALGQLGLIGSLIGLGVDVVGVSTPTSDGKISGNALRLLDAAGTSPLALVAQRSEQEISRRRLFALARTNPDAVFDLELRRLQLDSADARGLNCRASLAVTARLRDRRGATLWQKDAAATSGRTRTWREYNEQPRFARADFDSLAALVSRQLLADFPR